MKAPPLLFSNAKYRVSEAAFFFTRKLVAGKIAGFESFKTEKQTFVTVIRRGDVKITDRLFSEFVSFTVGDPKLGLTRANISDQLSYAKSRLREQIATARYSTEAGTQVLLENDPQVLKAVDALPQAEKLAETIMARG